MRIESRFTHASLSRSLLRGACALLCVINVTSITGAQMSIVPTATLVLPPPPGCTSASDTRAYNSGLAQGDRLVRSAFRTIRENCDRLESFNDIVVGNIQRLSLPPRSSRNLVCRYGGTVDGVYNALDAIFASCTDTCFAEGEFFGEVAGTAYCALSIALNGLVSADAFTRPPVLLCGVSFETGCDASFIQTTLDFPGDACLPYVTQEPFATVWDEFRNNQCVYELPPEQSNPDGSE
jgi:hypothetical protein